MARNRQRAKRRKAKQRKQQQRTKRSSKESARNVAATGAVDARKEIVEAPEPKQAPEPEVAPQSKSRPKEREVGPRHGKVLTFFIEVRSELKRVQWPDRSTLAQGTAVVFAACAIAGLYLGVWDYVWSNVVKALL